MIIDVPKIKSKRLFYLNRITDLLINTGNPKMRVEDIAASVGVTKKTLYNYFESREQLLDMVVDRYLEQKHKELVDIVRQDISSLQRLIVIARSFISIAVESMPIIVGKLGYVNDYELMPLLERKLGLFELVEYTVRKGVHEQLLQTDVDKELVSYTLISSIEMLYGRFPNSFSLKVNQMLYFLIKGSCTPIGVQSLRGLLDIEVNASLA